MRFVSCVLALPLSHFKEARGADDFRKGRDLCLSVRCPYSMYSEVAPAFCTTGQRQTAASARTDRRDAVLLCGVAESPSLLRRSCEAEIEFLCKEAFLMGMCTCERGGGDTRACNVARGLRGKTVLKYLIFCLQIKCLFCILSRICVNAQF